MRVVPWFCMAACVILFVRNQAIYLHAMRCLKRIYDAASDDIKRGLPWEWRYEAFNSVSFLRKLFLTFTRLDDFYPDKSFLEPRPPFLRKVE